MGRGPKKHLKRVKAPRSWMLSKLGGIYAPKCGPGAHKTSESIPVGLLLKDKLKYGNTGREVTMIMKDKEGSIKIDHKLKTDPKYPAGIMDVLSIGKTNEHFRVLYDVKGRFVLKKISPEEATYKLCKVTQKAIGPNKIPYIVTSDSRTIRFPHPNINVHDTIKYDIENKKVLDTVTYDMGNLAYVFSGNNIGRVGIILHKETHLNSHDIVHIKDEMGKSFATREENIIMIGKGSKPMISLTKDRGIYLNILEEAEKKNNGGVLPEKKKSSMRK